MSVDVIAVCASGPSLCRDDIYHLIDNKIPVMTINSSWKLYPECQYIFAGDEVWWKNNHHIIDSSAQKWTSNESAAKIYGINHFKIQIESTINSGLVAIFFAMSLGFENVILLGYDCSIEKGIHWHGKHLRLNNPNSSSIRRWRTEFELFSPELRRRGNVVNCSHETRLSCFPKAGLEKTLKRLKR